MRPDQRRTPMGGGRELRPWSRAGGSPMKAWGRRWRVLSGGGRARCFPSGWREPHEALASALADFERVEAVTLFPSGFAANLGTIAALVGPGDAVYLDRWDHACLVDGARLSRAKLRVYPHNDANRLEAILA